jgi:N-acetylmuramoyl-L-alanine amidase
MSQYLNSSGLTLIIDAGHGGTDGGAVSFSGLKESNFNLEIALKLEQLSAFLGINTCLTRESDEIDYPQQASTIHEKKVYDTTKRVELINSTQNAVLVSIHQNQFSSATVRGAQVLYAPTDGSSVFAANLQNKLEEKLSAGENRTAEQINSEIYIMNNINCPAILVECGFISCPDEETMLLTDVYQLKISAAIISSYIENESYFIQIYTGGYNEN